MVKRNFFYSMGAALLLAGAFGAWKSAPSLPATSSLAADVKDSRADVAGAAPAEGTLGALKPERSREELYADTLQDIYHQMHLEPEGLRPEVFKQALTGFYNLKAKGELSGGKHILSIVDFGKSSHEKRLWIIDLDKKELLFQTLVAHGKGSGAGNATHFSNRESSHQSSLGFYVTGEVYYGKHGRSLRLDGMDPGFNSNARQRAIVLHGADYVSQDFIDRTGRLGRSFGCPAVPVSLSGEIIDQISDKTVMFIHGPAKEYRSDYLNEQRAARYLLAANG